MDFSHPDFPRIAVDPEICFGKPRVKGTRMPVASILAYLAGGMTVEKFLAEFHWLTNEDVLEAIAFSSAMMEDTFLPIEKSS